MPYAILNPDRTIKDVVRKLSPFLVLEPNESIVGYNPPPLDEEVEDLTIINPVPEGSMEVTFTVTPKPKEETDKVWLRRKTAVIQKHLDDKARERGYDNILSAASYATSPHPRFGPEGTAYRDWRDSCWETGYDLMAEVAAGTRPMPSDEELIALLPVLTLPVST